MTTISKIEWLNMNNLVKSLERCPNGRWMLIMSDEGYFIDETLQGAVANAYDYAKEKGLI